MTPPHADCILAIDVGNTRIGMAVLDHDGVHDTRRVAAGRPGEWEAALRETWAATGGSKQRAIALASVRPDAADSMLELVQRAVGIEAWRVRDDLPLPMPVEVDSLAEVGVDRICSAAAAFDRVRQACAVASFGTATTIDCVSSEGRFIGGTILPGLGLCARALHEGTAALPLVELRAPAGVFGRNTRDAIAAGVVYGAVGALREIVERFATELREWPQLILTGGNAGLVAEHADFVDAVVPDLCLMGIALAYRRAAVAPV